MNGPRNAWYAFSRRRLLIQETGDGVEIPHDLTPPDLSLPPDEWHPLDLAVTGEGHGWGVDLGSDFSPPAGFRLIGLRGIPGLLSDGVFQEAGRAIQLLDWLRNHRFCSRCGAPAHGHYRARAMKCPECGQMHFPRLSPAVIVLVERDREMLLGRSPGWPDGVYSTLAGFVEPGESLEQAVHREIMEEVGVQVNGLRYFGSQPWPFPHSLMVGFVATYAGGEIRPDPEEIEDARWFAPDRLPPRLPSSYSIARALIGDFLARTGGSGAS